MNKLKVFGFFLILVFSCKKDKESEPSNPLNGKTTAVFNTSKQYGTMKDVDGNVYKTITIGTQTWMAENLRVTKYRNGDPISEVKDNSAWSNLSSGAYCNYHNTQNSDTIATYGRLYNWYAVKDSRNIAPDGWHVPTDAEWTTLSTYLGGEFVSGGKLKESGTIHWISPNSGATNESGFSALPSGYRDNAGSSNGIGYLGNYCGWWTSTEFDAINSWFRNIYTTGISADRSYYNKKGGFSIRCVMD